MDIYASVSPAGLKENETFVGNDDSVTLRKPTTTFVIELVQDGKELPKGSYVAEVSSFVKGDVTSPPQFKAQQKLTLTGGTASAATVRDRNAMQRWALGEMDFARPWTDNELRSKLGKFERYETPNAVNSVVYYFADADVSLFVDPTRGKVFTAKLGRVP
jgi:hypothetical protein